MEEQTGEAAEGGGFRAGNTNMKLLVLDVEGTLFKTKVRLPGTQINSTMWQGIASALGPDAIAEEVRTHERWHRGEYATYLHWVRDTILIHRKYGLTKSLLEQLVASAEYNENVAQALSQIDRTAFEPVLISGGFRELARRAQLDLNIHHAFAACEYLFGREARLRSFNLLPCDFEGKLDFIRLLLREYKLSNDDWVFLGDGLNDVPIAKTAPVSVAYAAHPELRAVSDFDIDDFLELPRLLTQLSIPEAPGIPFEGATRLGR